MMYKQSTNNHTKGTTQSATHSHFKPFSLLFVAMTALLLAACGDSDSNNQAVPTVTNSNTQSESPALTESNEQEKALDLDLDTTPLNKAAYLGLVDAPVPQVAPCPFLTDQSASTLVKSKFDLKLRNSANDQCMWSKNLGFSIKLSIESLATAKPISERAYNMDSPPVLKPQAAPGNNATVLYDTAWDKELAYAISFEQSDKLVVLFVTGMGTDASLLTDAAKEVANKLTNTVAEITPDSSAGPYDLCHTWSDPQMTTIAGAPVQSTTGKQECKWEDGSGEALKQIKVGIFYGKNHPWESLLEYRGSKDIPGIGERSILMKNRKQAEGWPANVTISTLYNELLVSVSVSDSIENNEAVALALAQNIDSRFE